MAIPDAQSLVQRLIVGQVVRRGAKRRQRLVNAPALGHRGGVQLLVQSRRQVLLRRVPVDKVQQQPDTESDQRNHHSRAGGQ